MMNCQGIQNLFDVMDDNLLEPLTFKVYNVKKFLFEMYCIYETKYAIGTIRNHG